MSKVFRRACTVFVLFGGLGIGACASPSGPSPISSGKPAQGEGLGQSSAQDVSSELKAPALSQGVTDVTLTNAGWTCIQPGNALTLCAPPGLGLPPIPPAADGQPTYNITAFTLDHQFVHHVKLLRPDLYHGQPCLGGDAWTYIDFLDYYECIIPGRGE
jgi:hypothetical protein